MSSGNGANSSRALARADLHLRKTLLAIRVVGRTDDVLSEERAGRP